MADKKTLEYQIKVLAQEAVAQLTDMSSKFKDMAQKASSASENIRKNSVTFINLESAAKQAAASVKLFGASSSELRLMQQKLKEGAVSLVAQGFKPEQEEVKKLVEQYKSLGRQADELDAKSGDITTVFTRLKSEIGNVAAVAAAVKFDKFLVKVSDYALQSADAINTVRNNFGIMLNDMEAGAALADRINAFNVNTPFNLEELSSATQVLKTAKVSLNDIEEYLTHFGDLALGDSQKFASFTNAFAKASAKGKADMEVLNIYLERGIPILDTLAKNMGKTSAEITDMASKGRISFADLNEAIKSLTNEGGGYFGTMNLAADSWASTLAGAREATNSLAASLGNMLMPVLKKIVNAYTEITNSINSSPLLKGLLVGAVTALAVAINLKMIVALVALVSKIWTTYAAQMALNSALSLTNPLLLAGIAAVTAATAGFVAYAAVQQKAAGESNSAALALKNQGEALRDLHSAADDYMAFMNRFDLNQSQKTVSNYEKAVKNAAASLRDSKERLSALQAELDATPKTVPLPGRRYAGLQAPNPDYRDIEKKVAAAQRIVDADQELYDTYKARLEVAVKATGELKQKILAFTNKWSEKLSDGSSSAIARLIEQEKKDVAKLEKEAEAAFGKNYTYSGTAEYKVFQRELTALHEYYEGERKKLREKEESEALKNVSSWLSKGDLTSRLKGIEVETKRSMDKLTKDALTAYGKEYETREEYIKAAANLEKYYAEENHKERLNQIEEYNSKFSKIIQNLQLKTVEAIKAGNVTDAVKNGTASATLGSFRNTEVGQVAEGFAAGGPLGALIAVIQALVNAITSAIQQLENGNKVLNFITTIVNKVFEEIGELVNGALAPTAKFLEKLGSVIGKIIKPLAQLAEDIAVIEPILNTLNGLLEGLSVILDGLNSVTAGNNNPVSFLLNPFGSIRNLFSSAESSSKAAVKAASESEEAQNAIKKLYERQIDRVKDLLDSQVTSLRTQYELGLITREDYDAGVLEYQKQADDKIYSLEEEMNNHIANIEAILEEANARWSGLAGTSSSEIEAKIKATIAEAEEKLKKISVETEEALKTSAKAVEELDKKALSEIQKNTDKALGKSQSNNATVEVSSSEAIVAAGVATTEEILAGVKKDIESAVSTAQSAAESNKAAIAAATGNVYIPPVEVPKVELPPIEIPKVEVPKFEPPVISIPTIVVPPVSFSFATGTPELLEDTPALVHKGETIVPKTFAEGIRQGELALVGGKDRGIQSGPVINLALTVEGNVVTEEELTNIVYSGIARAIQSGSKAPLPMSA